MTKNTLPPVRSKIINPIDAASPVSVRDPWIKPARVAARNTGDTVSIIFLKASSRDL
jgi:hypothetical protein